MKAFARVISIASALAAALILVLAVPAFAAGGTLNFIRSTPESGSTNVPVENVGVKLFFDDNVTDEGVWAANATCFKLTDSNRNQIPCEAYPGQKPGEEGYILVIARPTPATEGQAGLLEQKSVFTLTISPDLRSSSGAVLGEEISISFETMDVAANSRLSMVIMVVMMGGAIALMIFRNWHKMKAEAEAAALAQANPYRVAKEKSITVDEAKELIEKAREKNRKLLEKTGGKAPEPPEKKSAVPRIESKKKKKETHRVKGPKPISGGGGKFKTGRKAEKARKERAEAAKKASSSQQKTGAVKKNQKKGKKK